MSYYRATGNINIRTSPEVASNTTGQYVLTGDIVEVDTTQNGFVHIVRLYRNNVLVEIPPVSWCGAYYLEPTTYTPPTPSEDKIEVKVTENGITTTYTITGNLVKS